MKNGTSMYEYWRFRYTKDEWIHDRTVLCPLGEDFAKIEVVIEYCLSAKYSQ